MPNLLLTRLGKTLNIRVQRVHDIVLREVGPCLLTLVHLIVKGSSLTVVHNDTDLVPGVAVFNEAVVDQDRAVLTC